MGTKEKVLDCLVNERLNGNTKNDALVSGEKLAEVCGVSRAAIWKAVNALREQGILIEGSPNGGYALCEDDLFTLEVFKNILNREFPQYAECHAEIFEEIDSTNSYAKRVLSECGNLRLLDGTLTESGKKWHQAIIASETQTKGRGRLGRTFVSPAKSGIYLSVIYAPQGGIKNPAKVTAFSAVAVCRAIKKLYKIETKIKWINDIYAGGKKICGILTEGFTNFETGEIESAIIGIGINIHENAEKFPEDVAKVAGSIENSVKSDKNKEKIDFERSRLAVYVAAEVLNVLNENPEKVMQEYKEKSFLIGKTLQVHPVIGNDKTSYFAKAVDIDDNAGLVVETETGEKKVLSSGEVTLKSSEIQD